MKLIERIRRLEHGRRANDLWAMTSFVQPDGKMLFDVYRNINGNAVRTAHDVERPRHTMFTVIDPDWDVDRMGNPP